MTPILSILTDIQFCHWERDGRREEIRGDHLGLAHTHIYTHMLLPASTHRRTIHILSHTLAHVAVMKMFMHLTHTCTIVDTIIYLHQSHIFVFYAC